MSLQQTLDIDLTGTLDLYRQDMDPCTDSSVRFSRLTVIFPGMNPLNLMISGIIF